MRYAFVAVLASLPAWACGCFSNATACSALTSSYTIFVAEVTVDSGENWGKGAGKVAIVEALRNVPPGLRETWIDTEAGTSCYFRLKAGERYVIISNGPRYRVGGCSLSFPVQGNEHILDALRSSVNGGPPRLVGSVRKSSGRYSQDGTIPNATVELTRGDLRYATATDAHGHYVFNGLEPGPYKFRIVKDGYVADEDYNNRWSGRTRLDAATNQIEPVKDLPGELVITREACDIRSFAMWPAGTVLGTVRAVSGKPLPGVRVQAFKFDERGRLESQPLWAATTGEDGKYALHPIPAGRYVVGVNADPSSDEDAYPPARHAGSVDVPESGSVDEVDIVVSAPRTPARLRVKVIRPDGTPHKGARVRLDSPAGQQRWFSRGETDENGEMVVPVYLAERYTVEVFASPLEGTAQVEVVERESALTVVLH